MTDYSELSRVVYVPDGSTFVINQGSESGVKERRNYLIFRLGERVSDPVTGEDLGVLEVVIGRAHTIHVQPKMATLESTMKNTVPGKIRRVTREAGGILSFGGPVREEVEEAKTVTSVPVDAQVGDYARPV